MKRTWRIRRQTNPKLDGQQRWDRCYQLLLQWNQQPHPMNSLMLSKSSLTPTQERNDD